VGFGWKKNIFFDFVEKDGQSVLYKARVDEIWFSNKFCYHKLNALYIRIFFIKKIKKGRRCQ
jgi:uncharacterized protein (DUF1919 family)